MGYGVVRLFVWSQNSCGRLLRRGIGEYHKDQIVFSQGDPADAVFYIESGKVKVTVVSEQGKEQSSQFLERTISSVKDVLPDRLSAERRSRRCRTPSSCDWKKRLFSA